MISVSFLPTSSSTFSMPLTQDDSQPFQAYECHEGNYGVPNILSATRMPCSFSRTQAWLLYSLSSMAWVGININWRAANC